MAYEKTPRQLNEITFFDDAAWPLDNWVIDDSFCQHLRPRHSEFLRQLEQLFPDGFAGKHILDCGCGMGVLSVLLALRGAAVDACDLSPRMVTIAEGVVRESGVESMVNVQVAALEQLPFPAGTFDVVTGTDVLHHTDIASAASELSRVLKMGGHACFLEPVETGHLQRIVRAMYYRLPLVPKRASEHEHSITTNELAVFENLFDTTTVSLCCFDLFQHFARVVFWRRNVPMINKWTDRVDLTIDTLAPCLRRWSSERILMFQKHSQSETPSHRS